MYKFRFYFFAGAIILILMGALLKLQHYGNYKASFIAGIANFLIFIALQYKGKRDMVKR